MNQAAGHHDSASGGPSDTKPDGILHAARQRDDDALRKAIERLIDEVLLPAAVRETASRRRQVDFLPESFVQSVIADELPRAIAECADEAHLRARMVRALRHKVIDRTRKGGGHGLPVHFSQRAPAAGGAADPVAKGPGPVSQALSHERGGLEDAAFGHFASRLLESAADGADRTLLECYVVEGRRWNDVADAAGVSSEAARQRLARLRRSLLGSLCLPLRTMLDGESWTVAEAIFIQRQSPGAVARTLGMTESVLARTCRDRVFPVLAILYGDRGVDAILRLLGSRRMTR